jgi:hypothetical protein
MFRAAAEGGGTGRGWYILLMPGFVYFDSDTFHRIGATFSAQGLSPELRERILVSPITMLEVLSHLTLKRNAEILAHIHAVHNWLNPQRAGLLAWSTRAIAQIGFLKEAEPDDFTSRIQESINICLATDSPEELRESASKLKDSLDRMKESTSADFSRLVEGWRNESLTPEAFSEMWVHGIARRAKANPYCRPVADIISSLSAYHEFEEQRLLTAVNNREYNPDKNDLLDSEQLPYLGDSQLHFLTCDGGYLARIKKSPQAARIHKVALDELASVEKVEALLRKITA